MVTCTTPPFRAAVRLNSGVMPLRNTLRLNLAWSILMAMAFAALFIGSASSPRFVVLTLTIAYVGISTAAFRLKRWSLTAVILVAVLLTIRWLPMVIINFWMFFTRHPLYTDSPATIIIVAINALLFALPGLLLVSLYSLQWRSVRLALQRPRAGA